MKTVFLSFGCSILLILAFLSPKNVLARTEIPPIQFDHSSSNINDFENDYPTSYISRIKRFHHNQEGLDYFDPTFTEAGNYFPQLKNGSDKYNLSPYNFKNFPFWARLQNSSVIWQYTNDENYRSMIDNWNNTNNPYWAYGISATSPFGTFDFTAGLGYQPSELAALINTCQEGADADYRNFIIRRRSGINAPLGYFTGRVKADNTDAAPIAIRSLPTRAPQQVIINSQKIEKPNFTKNVPTNIQWNRGRGISSGTNKHQSVLSKWERSKNSSNRSRYDSFTNNASATRNNQTTTNNNQQYNNLSSGNKSKNVSTNNSNTTNKNYNKTATQKSVTTVNSNN